MAEPIPVKVTRYACPYCYYSRSRKRATVEHIARCWRNPDVKGCKTCVHHTQGVFGDVCAEGVDLSGHPACEACYGLGNCEVCGGDAVEVRPGPIVGCDKWQAASR